MTKTQRELLAIAYQSAFYAAHAQEIIVTVTAGGLFKVNHDNSPVFLPEWSGNVLGCMSATAVMRSLAIITRDLALKREREKAKREQQENLTYTRV